MARSDNSASLAVGEERIDPSEEAVFDEFASFLTSGNDERYPQPPMMRAVQPKQHGLVRAEFTVEAGLPDDLAVGLFATPATYPAFVRFASQNPESQSDTEKDNRGMSIKVCGVPGDTFHGEPTQDFLMISINRFSTSDTASFLRLRQAEKKGRLALLWFFFNPLRWEGRTFRNVMAGREVHANPLTVRYFSATPFKYGTGAAKFSARPVGVVAQSADRSSPNFLRLAMAGTLDRGEAVFDFEVQLQTDAGSMPIEDAGKEWSEAESPFRKVATIRIPQQPFNNKRQDEFGENLSFTPWHSVRDHRPLGGVNRARLKIYEATEKQRRERNEASRKEPAGSESFE